LGDKVLLFGAGCRSTDRKEEVRTWKRKISNSFFLIHFFFFPFMKASVPVFDFGQRHCIISIEHAPAVINGDRLFFHYNLNVSFG